MLIKKKKIIKADRMNYCIRLRRTYFCAPTFKFRPNSFPLITLGEVKLFAKAEAEAEAEVEVDAKKKKTMAND